MTKQSVFWLAAIPVTVVLGCSGGDNQSSPGAGGNFGVGGSNGTGGLTHSGGSSAVASSAQSTGGTTAMGEVKATGGANPTGGAPATGGAVAAGGSIAATGGTKATTSTKTIGGAQATGGASAQTSAAGGSTELAGGSTVAGGTAAGGSRAMGGGVATGGSKATGGGATTGGSTASSAMGGGVATGGSKATGGGAAAGGSTATGDCPKGPTQGSDVAVIGDSFIAMSHGIPTEIQSKAQAAGSLASGTKYKDNSVSGTLLSGNGNDAIPKQYARAVPVKYVLMDGGGNDCLLANDSDAALAAATTLLTQMGKDGVLKVQYFFYPDPLGSYATGGTLKPCLDALRPKMKALCDGLTAPKCYWLDLRPVWNGHSEYAQSDGIHPTDAGSKATGDAIWAEMVKNCIAQ